MANRVPTKRARKYWIVKHGLDAFEALPDFIWRTGMGPREVPQRFPSVRLGDQWLGFAYEDNDNRTRRLSLVTGFYECTREYRYGPIPRRALDISDREKKAWMIEGEPVGRQPRQPVGVPPIADLIGRRVWNSEAITPITPDEFEHVCKYTLAHQLDTNTIPFLKREPHNEQELLAAVVAGHKKLGIEEIVRIQTAFPDLLVKIKGHAEKVHLELEVYSKNFFLHRHDEQVDRNRRFTGDKRGDKKPVAILCWIDNDERVRKHVHRVYELQSLIREGKRIRW